MCLPEPPGTQGARTSGTPSSLTLLAAWASAVSKARQQFEPTRAHQCSLLSFPARDTEVPHIFSGLSPIKERLSWPLKCPSLPWLLPAMMIHTENPVRSPDQALSPGAFAGPRALDPERGQRPMGGPGSAEACRVSVLSSAVAGTQHMGTRVCLAPYDSRLRSTVRLKPSDGHTGGPGPSQWSCFCIGRVFHRGTRGQISTCLLYTSDAADEVCRV